MGTGADVRDILELTGGENDGPISKKDLINSDKVGEALIIIPVNLISVLCHYLRTFKLVHTHIETDMLMSKCKMKE